MERIPLGRSALRVSPVILGSMSLKADRETRAGGVRIIQALIDAGLTTIDTAPLYELGRCESLVGEAIRGRRDEVQLLTKVGLRWDDDPPSQSGCPAVGTVRFAMEDPGGTRRTIRHDSRPESLRLEVEASLRRLGVEQLDLVQVHARDHRTPVADTMGALAELHGAGKVGNIGVSNYTARDMLEAQRALGSIPLASNQVRYSLSHRDVEGELVPFALQAGVDLLTYSPLDRGVLAGRLESIPGSTGPRTRASLRLALEGALADVAAAHGAKMSQIALAWLLQQAGVTAVIAGASTLEQAISNAGAGAVSLTHEELAQLREAFKRTDGQADASWKQRAKSMLRATRQRWRVRQVKRAR